MTDDDTVLARLAINMLLNNAPVKTVDKNVQVIVQRKLRDETELVPRIPSLRPFEDFIQIGSVNVARRLYGSTHIWCRGEPRNIKRQGD